MKPSQQRQLRWWLRFWVMVGGAFLVTLAAMARLAEWYRDVNGMSEKSQAAVRSAVQSGMIQATPIRTLGKLEPAVTIITRPPGNEPPMPPTAPPPGTVANTMPAITLSREDNGRLTLSSPAAAGTTYYLEASFDLRAWVTIATNIANTSTAAFALSNSPTVGNVYYRLRAPSAPIFVSPGTGGFVSPTVGKQAGHLRRFSRVVSSSDAVTR